MVRTDAHLHVFASASEQFPREPDDLAPAGRAEPVEKFIGCMEEHGIDQAMLVQMGGASIAHHAYLRHSIARYPDRFLGIGLVPDNCAEPEAHMDALAAQGGIVGFRLGALGGPRDPFAEIDVRSFASYRIWQHAAKRDYVLWLFLPAAEAHLAAYMVDAFPQVRVVFNHLGICPGAGKYSVDEWGRPRDEVAPYNPALHTVWRLGRYENVTVILSGEYSFSREAYPHRDLAGWHANLLRKFGSERLMWASDAPWIYEEPGYGACVAILDELLPDLSEKEREDIMGGTARRFLRFR